MAEAMAVVVTAAVALVAWVATGREGVGKKVGAGMEAVAKEAVALEQDWEGRVASAGGVVAGAQPAAKADAAREVLKGGGRCCRPQHNIRTDESLRGGQHTSPSAQSN